jgi:hypothetical protein
MKYSLIVGADVLRIQRIFYRIAEKIYRIDITMTNPRLYSDTVQLVVQLTKWLHSQDILDVDWMVHCISSCNWYVGCPVGLSQTACIGYIHVKLTVLLIAIIRITLQWLCDGYHGRSSTILSWTIIVLQTWSREQNTHENQKNIEGRAVVKRHDWHGMFCVYQHKL